MRDAPTVSVYMTRKVNLGDYESVDVFVKWDGVPVPVNSEWMEGTANITGSIIDILGAQVKEKTAAIKREVERDRESDAERRRNRGFRDQ